MIINALLYAIVAIHLDIKMKKKVSKIDRTQLKNVILNTLFVDTIKLLFWLPVIISSLLSVTPYNPDNLTWCIVAVIMMPSLFAVNTIFMCKWTAFAIFHSKSQAPLRQ